MMPPCGGCPDRSVGCHGTCEKYQTFNAERELIRAKRAEQAGLFPGVKKNRPKINPKKLR